MSEREASTKAMIAIKFLALRRFNYIDSTGNFAAIMIAYNGFYILGGIVFIFTILTSVSTEMIAEKAKRCHAK